MQWFRGLLAMLAVVLSAGCGGPQHTAGGPLEGTSGYLSYYLMGLVGTEFSEGFSILRTSEPVVVESVEVIGGGEALDYLGAQVGLPGRPDDFNQFMKGFPPGAVPARYQAEAAGLRLEPDQGYMLILGYRVAKHVMDLRTAVVVKYRTQDGERFREEFPARVLTCPPSLDTAQCTQQAIEKYGDDEID